MTVLASLHSRPQGAVATRGNSIRWCVWAPNHAKAQLVIGEGDARRLVPMAPLGDGYFTVELSDIDSGTRYAYRLGEGTHDLPDPASRWQPDGVHRASAVFRPGDFSWHDADWKGVPHDELVIYELHVGSFTPEGTFAAIIPRLAALRELGVTAIEIMPVSQFPGRRNWGYDGVHPYATQHSYGGPLGLVRLVDAAHQAGIAVFLDVVYNHLGPEGNYLGQFGPYFTDRYHTPWGAALNFDGPDSDPVRSYVIENACQWIRDFHIDGLRLDAVQTIIDQSAYHLLAELQAQVQATAAACGRTATVIAETDQNDARITADAQRGGFGLDGVWNDDFHHAVHSLLTGEKDGYYADFGAAEQLAKAYRDGFIFDGQYSPYRRRRHGSSVAGQPRKRLTVCIQNHDQIGNRALGERLAALVTPAAQRLAAAILLISPDTPLLFMGEEYGETNPFPFFCSFTDAGLIDAVREGRKREFAELAFRWHGDIPDATAASTFEQARLSWDWQTDPLRRGLRSLYQTLLAARRSWPPLVEREHCTARILDPAAAQQVLVVERGHAARLLAVANLSAELTTLPGDVGGARIPLLSTAERRFGGDRDALGSPTRLDPYEMILWGDTSWT